MKKNLFLIVLIIVGAATLHAQTLFTIGNETISSKEFMRAYKKNNTQPVGDKAKSINEYLGLYIKSKLKVKAAEDRGLDSLPALVTEVQNLRSQIADNYMTDPEVQNKLVQEAFDRSQKDIHVAHIFISFRNAANITDTAASQQKKDEVVRRLKKGEDFAQVAKQYSDDPSVKENSGDLGFITVFTLPYEFENAIYNTATGKYTAPIRSKIGYHIFKVIESRKAYGKIKAQQILLANPPGADEAAKNQVAAEATNLYKQLKAGENFSTLAAKYSNDYASASSSGNIADVGVGEYDPVFEKAVFALVKDGEITLPFQTSHGWHIVKRVALKPIVSDKNDKEYLQQLRQKVVADGRWKTANDFIYNRVTKGAGYKKLIKDDAGLWAYSDSLLNFQKLQPAGRAIKPATILMVIGKKDFKADDWINYARSYRFNADGSGAKPYPQVWDEWVKYAMMNYYKDHLEEFNEDFRYQMKEFKEGNLFFEIMQEEVWNKAQADTDALKKLYDSQPSKYYWKPSADVAIFFSSDADIAKKLYSEVSTTPNQWKTLADKYPEIVIADSGRYEWSQIPNLEGKTPSNGMITKPIANNTDNTTSFAYIIKTYKQATQRSFTEARGLVINDYQEVLEKQLDEKLRKKYPVVVNEKVLKGLVK